MATTGGQIRSNGGVLRSGQVTENRNFDKISMANSSIETQGSESDNGFLCTHDKIQILTKACRVLQNLALAFPFCPIPLYTSHCLLHSSKFTCLWFFQYSKHFSDSEPFYMLFPLPGILSPHPDPRYLPSTGPRS